MTATPDCQAWCTEHHVDNENECYTEYVIFDKEEDSNPDVAALDPVAASLRAQLSGFNGASDPDIARVHLHGSLGDYDEQTIIEIAFHPAGEQDDPSAVLSLTIDELKKLHAKLGAVIKDFT